MKLGKVLVAIVFAVAICWGVQRFVYLGGLAFSVAGVGFSWTMVTFALALVAFIWLTGRK